MKKGTIGLLVVGVVILMLIGGTLTTYNSLVAKDEAVTTAWGNIHRNISVVPTLCPTW